MCNADIFKKTLQQAEETRDVAPLVALFGDDATIDSPAREHKFSGRVEIQKFWHEYIEAFATVRSSFTTDHTIGDTSVLQWVSEGTLPTGRPIKYRGVTIVTFRGYKVSTFTTYYDSAAFVAPSGDPYSGLTVATGAINNEGGD
ncbi:MAG: hypothetical protein JWM57_4104 [Phycisphaerales bacterium]|nr:hypothetical protein [Phycisphaerales bacterium]